MYTHTTLLTVCLDLFFSNVCALKSLCFLSLSLSLSLSLLYSSLSLSLPLSHTRTNYIESSWSWLLGKIFFVEKIFALTCCRFLSLPSTHGTNSRFSSSPEFHHRCFKLSFFVAAALSEWTPAPCCSNQEIIFWKFPCHPEFKIFNVK